MSWVRLWRDMPTDPKFRAIARRSGRPLSEVISLFAYMMTRADENGDFLDWCDEDAGAALDIETEDVGSIVTAMQGKTLDGKTMTGWAKRQPKREDDSRKRVQAHRERKKQERNAGVTLGNAPESESESESDGESYTPLPDAAREEMGGCTDAYSDLKSNFNGSTGAMLDFIERTMGGGCRSNAEQWLASTVTAHGAAAVAQGYASLMEKQATGQYVSRPLPLWSSMAAGIKAKGAQPKKRTLADALASKERKTVSEILAERAAERANA